MPTTNSAIAHRHDLTDRLAASSVRLGNYERRLLAGTSNLRPIDFDRLLDDYRAELIRYDRLEREFKELALPTPSEASKARWKNNKPQRDKINY